MPTGLLDAGGQLCLFGSERSGAQKISNVLMALFKQKKKRRAKDGEKLKGVFAVWPVFWTGSEEEPQALEGF